MNICTKSQKTELNTITGDTTHASDKCISLTEVKRSSSNRKLRNGRNCWPFANLKLKTKNKGQPDLDATGPGHFHGKFNDVQNPSTAVGKTWFKGSKKMDSRAKTIDSRNNEDSRTMFPSIHTTIQSLNEKDVLVSPNSVSSVSKTCENSSKVPLENSLEYFMNQQTTAGISSPSLANHSSCLRTEADVAQLSSKDSLTGSPNHTRYSQLAAAVDYCDRRLERLYGRLIWLRNSAELPVKLPDDDLIKSSCGEAFSQNKPSSLATKPASECKNDSSAYQSVPAIDAQISSLSERINQLKNQIESYAYLSWIGLSEEPQTAKLVMPGKRCPAPNPQLHLVRRPDSQFRTIAEEYRRLCPTVLPEKTRLSLRETTFNNWPWSDPWLIRFVRQMFFDLSLVEHFNICTGRLDTWLCDVYRRYNRIPFHNYKHAFMVTQMAYAIMWSANLHRVLPKEEQLILLLSAICHDLDHPGFNNAYQINAGTELAIRYNDQSPLENHHAAMAFDILSRSEANLLSHLDNDTFRRIREGIIRCILATDMSRHNDILSQFRETLLNDLEACQSIDPTTNRPLWSTDKTKLDLVMMMLIKLCDISNEARPLTVSDPWINRLLAEFFNQSDYEKVVGLPVAPFMDRDDVTKASSQCGFIRFVILPLYEAAARLIPELEDVIVKPVIFQLDYYTEMQTVTEEGDAVDGDPVPADQPVKEVEQGSEN